MKKRSDISIGNSKTFMKKKNKFAIVSKYVWLFNNLHNAKWKIHEESFWNFHIIFH